MTTLYAITPNAPARAIATGFDPEDPPSVCWLWDLIRAEPSAKMTASELRAALGAGKRVVLTETDCLEWREQ